MNEKDQVKEVQDSIRKLVEDKTDEIVKNYHQFLGIRLAFINLDIIFEMNYFSFEVIR